MGSPVKLSLRLKLLFSTIYLFTSLILAKCMQN